MKPKQQSVILCFHLKSGHTIEERFQENDINDFWSEITDKMRLLEEYIEVFPSDTYHAILLPKSSISFISVRIDT